MFDGPEFDIRKETQPKITTRILVNTNLPCQHYIHIPSNLAKNRPLRRSVPPSVTRKYRNRSFTSLRPGLSKKPRQRNSRTPRILFKLFLPRSANTVSSHHFFNVKFDRETGKLQLKYRIVPHSNKDDLKDEIRSDSSTAQFLIIRTVLSMAALHKLRMLSLTYRRLICKLDIWNGTYT